MPTAGQRRRNLARGRCAECPRERAPRSTRFCETHLEKNRVYQLQLRRRRGIPALATRTA